MPDGKVFPSCAEEEEEDTKDEGETSQENVETIYEEDENPSFTKLRPSRKKALLELRSRVEDAIHNNYILGKKKGKRGKVKRKGKSSRENGKERENLKDITLWGVPLLPSKGHEGTNVVLMKFLKTKDFKVSEAFKMLQRTLKWRRDFNAEGILDENLCSHLENLICINGTDKQGHPVCYITCGALKDKELYMKTFGSRENFKDCLRWRIQFMEKGIQELSFNPGGVDAIVQITDLKNSPGPAMKELHLSNRKTMMLLQEYYPELIFKNIVINVPFWNFMCHALHWQFITQRNKSKFIFARPSRVTETLVKYIAPENIPVQYGGLKREDDDEFSSDDTVSELIVKVGAKGAIKIPMSEIGVTVVWDVIAIGHGVSYKEEFVPDDDCSYNLLLQMEKKMGRSVRNSFYINEPGKIVITIENQSYKKKKVFYRYKTKLTLPVYIFK
ncbi:patellin-4-like [Cornus florida]|uniref:patellin-4-like n=1 Tax=Cornus florida TaxID=4283 RepID=UPI0028A1F361|nr:patellin-4-like [Cornus florida]